MNEMQPIFTSSSSIEIDSEGNVQGVWNFSGNAEGAAVFLARLTAKFRATDRIVDSQMWDDSMRKRDEQMKG